MRRALLALALLPAAFTSAETRSFGKPLQGLPATTLEAVLSKPEPGKAVRLEGTIGAVCQNKGCWLSLKQGARSVHVTFEGYSFFLPKDAAGQPVVLEGKVVVKEPKPAEVEHLKQEGAGAAAAARVSIEATGVELR
jgi:hypothetical protein